jgi:hypothetical protein
MTTTARIPAAEQHVAVQTPTQPTTAGRRSQFLAWLAVAFAPITFVAGFIVAFVIAGAMDVDIFDWDQMSAGQYAAVMVPAALVWMSAPLLAVVAGARAVARGRRWASVPVVLGGAALAWYATDLVSSLMELAG